MKTELPLQTFYRLENAGISLINTRFLTNLVVCGGITLGLSLESLEKSYWSCVSQLNKPSGDLTAYGDYSYELDLFLSRSSVTNYLKSQLLAPYLNVENQFDDLIGLLALSARMTGINQLKDEYNFVIESIAREKSLKGVH